MNEFTPKLDSGMRTRLQSCAKRLSKLIDLNAPDSIIAQEVVMLFHYCEPGVGTLLWQKLGEYSFYTARRRVGLCAKCDEPIDDVQSSYIMPMCRTHRLRTVHEDDQIGDGGE